MCIRDRDKLDKVDTLEGQIKANKVQVTGDAVTGVKVADKKEADGSTTYTVSLDKKIHHRLARIITDSIYCSYLCNSYNLW